MIFVVLFCGVLSVGSLVVFSPRWGDIEHMALENWVDLKQKPIENHHQTAQRKSVETRCFAF
jgi:hypothetical protein